MTGRKSRQKVSRATGRNSYYAPIVRPPTRHYYVKGVGKCESNQKVRDPYYRALRLERVFIRKLLLWNETRVTGKAYGFARRIFYNILPKLFWALSAKEDRLIISLVEDSLASYIYRCKLTRLCSSAVLPLSRQNRHKLPSSPDDNSHLQAKD
jgi:hypothetical protein